MVSSTRSRQIPKARLAWLLLPCIALLSRPAMAGGPFATGATALQSNLQTILTPIALIAVMVSGVLGWFGKISWWWLVGVVLGTVMVFGSSQIVSWIRTMFGV